MFLAQSTTKDYIRAKHKLHSISKLFISQVMIPQVMFLVVVGVVVFLASLYYAGTQHGNLHPAARVTYFILQANTGTSVSLS